MNWDQMKADELIAVYRDSARSSGDRLTALAHMFDRHREGCAHPSVTINSPEGWPIEQVVPARLHELAFDVSDEELLEPEVVEQGDVVCFRVDGEDWPAIVTKVWSDTCVNLFAFRDQRLGPFAEQETPKQHFTSCIKVPDGDQPADWSWRFYEMP